MAFTIEQHVFVSVYDRNCIKEHGYSSKDEDWTLVYYPAVSETVLPDSQDYKKRVMKVHYPKSSSFGEVVHWLDAAYALDTASWSKHASICLTSHEMNLLVLYLDTKSIKKT